MSFFSILEVFHVAILKNKVALCVLMLFSEEKLKKNIPKQTNHGFCCFFPIFSIIFPCFFTVKNDQKTSFSLHELIAELSRSWQMSQKLR